VKFPGPTRHMLSKDDPLDKTATFLPLLSFGLPRRSTSPAVISNVLGMPPSWSTPGPDDKWRLRGHCLQLYLEQPIKGRRMAAPGVSTDVGCKELPIGSAN